MANEEVGSLKVSLSLDNTDFNRPIASVERNLKTLGGELSIIRSKGKEWGDSVEGLRTKQETLGRTLSLQETKVKSLRTAYERSVREKGADAAATENLAAKLNRAIAEYTRTETEIDQVNTSLADQQEELRHAESAWGRMETSLESAGDKLTATGDKMKGAGEKMMVGITTPIVGIGIAAIKTADEFDSAGGRIQSGLGLTAKEAEALEETAKSLWENGFSGSVIDAADAVVTVSKNLSDLPTDQLEKITGFAGILADRFEIDIAQSTNTAGMVMRVFGDDAETAFDLMTYGLQNAKGDSGELLDTFNEYAPQFEALGYSAEGFMATLVEGSQSGAFNMDLLGDAAKESFLLIGEGSDDVKTKLKDMGLDAGQVIDDINGGGEDAQKAFMAVSSAIAGIKDPTEKTAAAIALFGTPIEDLGPQFQGFFSDVDQDLKGVEGSTKRAGDALYDNLGARATTIFRDFQADLQPVGDILIDVAEDYLPKLADGLGELTEGFADMSPKAQENAVMIAGVAAAAGPALVVIGTLATGIGGLATAGSGLMTTLGAAGGAGLLGRLGLMGVVGGPVGLAIAGAGTLAVGIYALTEASKESTAESVKVIEGKQAEIAKNDELIASYEGLREKNVLSNEQMMRFLDIQAQLSETTAPDTIAALKEEQALLLEKSTLTNDEMGSFLSLNQELIEAAPDTIKAISSEGEAFALNTIAVRELNAEKAKELENGARELLTESLDREKGLLQEQKDLIFEINEANVLQAEQKEVVRSKANEISQIERDINELENQKNGASLEQTVALDDQIQRKEQLLWQAGDEKSAAEELLSTYGKQMTKKEEELDKNRQSLAQADAAKFKYEEIILAQAGITSEKGRGIEKINEELGKLETQKAKQRELLSAGKINTAEYQNQIEKINGQVGRLQEAKGELTLINAEAGKTVYKDVKISESPRNFWDTLDANLRRQVTKTVSIKYNARSGPQDMGMYAHANGTDSHPGGLALVGDGVGNNAGRELITFPSGKTALSPAKPTIMNLPKGTSVLSALNTKKFFGNIPQYANGTADLRVGGLNPEALVDAIKGAMTVSNGKVSNQPINLTVQIPIDGRVIAERTFEISDELNSRNKDIQNMFQGGRTI